MMLQRHLQATSVAVTLHALGIAVLNGILMQDRDLLLLTTRIASRRSTRIAIVRNTSSPNLRPSGPNIRCVPPMRVRNPAILRLAKFQFVIVAERSQYPTPAHRRAVSCRHAALWGMSRVSGLG